MPKKKKCVIRIAECNYPGSCDKEGCMAYGKKNARICLCPAENPCSYRKKTVKLKAHLKKIK